MKNPALLLALTGALAISALAADETKPAATATPAAPAETKTPEGAPARRRMVAMTPEERLKDLKEKLNLTEEQVPKVKAVLDKSYAKLKDMRADTTGTPEEKRTKYRDAMKETMQEMAPILTPEQQAKWREQMSERRAAGGAAQKK